MLFRSSPYKGGEFVLYVGDAKMAFTQSATDWVYIIFKTDVDHEDGCVECLCCNECIVSDLCDDDVVALVLNKHYDIETFNVKETIGEDMCVFHELHKHKNSFKVEVIDVSIFQCIGAEYSNDAPYDTRIDTALKIDIDCCSEDAPDLEDYFEETYGATIHFMNEWQQCGVASETFTSEYNDSFYYKYVGRNVTCVVIRRK